MIQIMQTNHTVDVAALDAMHRHAFEDVIGQQLRSDQQLVIGVKESTRDRAVKTGKRAQTPEDWARVYAGLTDEQIEEIDKIINTRANFSRDLP